MRKSGNGSAFDVSKTNCVEGPPRVGSGRSERPSRYRLSETHPGVSHFMPPTSGARYWYLTVPLHIGHGA